MRPPRRFGNTIFTNVSNSHPSRPIWQYADHVLAVMLMRLGLTGIFISLILLVGCGRNDRMDTVYAERCLSCHGPGGRGDGALAAMLPNAPPDFRETVQRKSNGQIRRVIAEGRGLMPAFEPALRPSEITDMLQMVRFLSREGRDVAWWERFDALVVAHCSIPWETVLGYDEPPEKK